LSQGIEEIEALRQKAEQVLVAAQHAQQIALAKLNAKPTGGFEQSELQRAQESVQNAQEAFANANMEKTLSEKLNGLVLVHYLDERAEAAVVLQKNVRDMLDRKRQRTDSPPKRVIDGIDEEEELEFEDFEASSALGAAVLLQANYRGHHVRKKAEEENQMSTVLQKHFRGHIARKALARQNDASHVLGRHVRGHLVRKDIDHQNKASRLIGRHVRNHLARKKEAGGDERPGFQVLPEQLRMDASDADMRATSPLGQGGSSSMGSMDFIVSGLAGLPLDMAGNHTPQLTPASSHDSEQATSPSFHFGFSNPQSAPLSVADVQLATLRQECAALREEADRKEALLKQRESDLRMSHSTIEGMKQMIRERDARIGAMGEGLEEKDTTIRALHGHIRALQQVAAVAPEGSMGREMRATYPDVALQEGNSNLQPTPGFVVHPGATDSPSSINMDSLGSDFLLEEAFEFDETLGGS